MCVQVVFETMVSVGVDVDVDCAVHVRTVLYSTRCELQSAPQSRVQFNIPTAVLTLQGGGII